MYVFVLDRYGCIALADKHKKKYHSGINHNHRNGSLMGIRLSGHKNRMAGYAARMLCRVQESHLPKLFDTLLPSALLDAFDRCWDNRTRLRQLAHWDV